MTKQEIFDRVKTHLLTQNERAASASGSDLGDCSYRIVVGEKTLKCAIGCLIPDELYRPELEGTNISSPAVQEVLIKAGVLDENTVPWIGGPVDDKDGKFTMLAHLQAVHDSCPVHSWPGELATVASRFGLQYADGAQS
jgi:hypothetical protein